MTLKFDGWPRKFIGHLFYTASSFVSASFKTIGEFKLELQSGNAQFRVKIGDFFVPCDLEIAWMTLKNKRAPLLCYVKLCTSFQSHLVKSNWSYNPETLNSGQNRWFFLSSGTFKIDEWPWNTIGHLFYVASSFVYHFIAIGEFKLKLESGNAQSGSKSAIFCPVWPWNLTDDLEKQ